MFTSPKPDEIQGGKTNLVAVTLDHPRAWVNHRKSQGRKPNENPEITRSESRSPTRWATDPNVLK